MRRTDRRDVYRLLGGLLDEQPPSDELCTALVADRTLARLGLRVGGRLGAELARMHTALAAGPDAWSALRRDHLRLFIGPRKKLAPPWESVYRTPGRLVLQDAEQHVARAYAAQRVGFDGMGQRPADHVALELQFCAILVDQSGRRAAARTALRRFLDQHLLVWVPAFAADVHRLAGTEFFRALAATLLALCEVEAATASAAAA